MVNHAYIFVRDGRPHGQGGAKLEINGMSVSVSVAALIARLYCHELHRVFDSKVRSMSGSKEPSAPSSKFARVKARMGAKISFEEQISQGLLMCSLVATAAASLDARHSGEQNLYRAPTRHPHLFGGQRVGFAHDCGGVRWRYHGGVLRRVCSDGRAGFA